MLCLQCYEDKTTMFLCFTIEKTAKMITQEGKSENKAGKKKIKLKKKKEKI